MNRRIRRLRAWLGLHIPAEPRPVDIGIDIDDGSEQVITGDLAPGQAVIVIAQLGMDDADVHHRSYLVDRVQVDRMTLIGSEGIFISGAIIRDYQAEQP